MVKFRMRLAETDVGLNCIRRESLTKGDKNAQSCEVGFLELGLLMSV